MYIKKSKGPISLTSQWFLSYSLLLLDNYLCYEENENTEKKRYRTLYKIWNISENKAPIRSSDNDSTGFWPPGSLHILGADGHI